MVPVVKKNGKVWICADLKWLNQADRRERFMLPTLKDIMPKLAGAGVFTTLDASSGFRQISLDPRCVKLTTFITPRGRFCFQHLLFGITSAPEIFQRETCILLRGHKGTVVVMDDILVYGKDQDERDRNLKAVLQTIKASGLKLNREKCRFSKSELQYFGHIISKDGIKPDPGKGNAISDMQSPENVTQVRQWLGMVNYLGRFLPELSSVLHPVSELLKKEAEW